MRIALLALCACAFAAFAGALPATFDPNRDAEADVAAAVAQAKAQGKRVLVDVGGEWCTWCHIMDRFLAADADARGLLERGFVMVKVNYSRENANASLLSRYPRVAGYPHLFVLGADGALLHSQDTGALESGKGYDRAKFVAFLHAWSPPR